MYDIQLNESGSRHLTVTEENMATLQKYNLLSGLGDSTGYVTESVLDRLKLNIRSLIASSTENTKDLVDLCIDVISLDTMYASGLRNLLDSFLQWEESRCAS